ncbi:MULTISPECIES: hypothetical protein [unclassified Campylobacter]|uniref:hypothetical protein n=1 Tax=unclassified Campylobacter TaxID=2593542 RepID=UPI002024F156|nr:MULTISPECIES: hypothetical protein [unclassified Campylobacter]
MIKCPQCGSENIKKERIDIEEAGDREIDTGDRVCKECGYTSFKTSFEYNIVKQTCKELNLTYKQLGELIGVSEGRVKQLAIGEVGEQVQKSCEMLLKINELEKKLSEQNQLKTLLKNFIS